MKEHKPHATNRGFASGGVTPMLPLVDRGRLCKLGPDSCLDCASNKL